jgi:hypothetical protein
VVLIIAAMARKSLSESPSIPDAASASDMELKFIPTTGRMDSTMKRGASLSRRMCSAITSAICGMVGSVTVDVFILVVLLIWFGLFVFTVGDSSYHRPELPDDAVNEQGAVPHTDAPSVDGYDHAVCGEGVAADETDDRR